MKIMHKVVGFCSTSNRPFIEIRLTDTEYGRLLWNVENHWSKGSMDCTWYTLPKYESFETIVTDSVDAILANIHE